jgi:hypothetical protein
MLKRMRRVIGVGMAAALAACGTDPAGPDPALAPFVGTWDAVAFTVTGDAPPNTVANILQLGPFWITVEPSGQYIATLEFLTGFPVFGQMTVESGSALTLNPTNPAGPPEPSVYVFATADSLIMDGPTQFDFNLDGTDEAAQAHLEIVRRPD